jgi:hypothetical protein
MGRRAVQGAWPSEPRFCGSCNQNKPFAKDAPVGRKVAGFMGAKCWDCYIGVTKTRRADILAAQLKAKLEAEREARVQLGLSRIAELEANPDRKPAEPPPLPGKTL